MTHTEQNKILIRVFQMKKKSAMTFFICLIMTRCVMNKIDDSSSVVSLDPPFNGMAVKIDINKGSSWSQKMQAGPFIFNILPQIVIWAEDEQGKLFETLYITGADYNSFRHAGKNNKGVEFYVECFPVWAQRMASADRKLPSKENPFPDSVTSATPSSSFSLKTTLPELKEPVILRIEINQSDDTNTFYTKENNDWVGQPSLIYELKIQQFGKKDIYEFKLIGHGGFITDRASIYKDLTGFDTALEQIESIVLRN